MSTQERRVAASKLLRERDAAARECRRLKCDPSREVQETTEQRAAVERFHRAIRACHEWEARP